ncbi:MAG: response regulator [Bacteroidetes bacterium]|nr:response regulator [Bacteroidota bacterium]
MTQKRILVIEDHLQLRENIAELLKLSNYTVDCAADGKEGVEKAANNPPDLIISDVNMPTLDGYGVLNLLSKIDETADIPFIFLTSNTDRKDMRKGMEMGADDYITKPFEASELLNTIDTRLRKKFHAENTIRMKTQSMEAFFSEVNGMQDFLNLFEHRETAGIRKKEVIYHEGQNPRFLYYVQKGKVKTTISNSDGKELINGLYRAGDFFGYLALLENHAYSDSAAAFEDSELLLIPKEDFFALIYKNRLVSEKFIRLLADDVAGKEEMLMNLAYKSVRQRAAHILLSLCSEDGSTMPSGEQKVTISREELAQIVGASTETVIRALSSLKEDGLLELKTRDIILKNPAALRELLD